MTTKEAEERYLRQHIDSIKGKKVSVFNPKEIKVEDLPVIIVFSNVIGGGCGTCFAMAEDGIVLGSHYCSHETYALSDLGVLEGCRENRHEEYRKHYPDGYRMMFVSSNEVGSHQLLQQAFEKNQQTQKEEEV